MIKDQEPLPPGTNPDIAAHVHRLRGHNELSRLMIGHNEQTIESLLRGGFLPPAPAAPPVRSGGGGGKKGGGGTGGTGGAAASLMADMDAKWGDIPGLPSDCGAST